MTTTRNSPFSIAIHAPLLHVAALSTLIALTALWPGPVHAGAGEKTIELLPPVIALGYSGEAHLLVLEEKTGEQYTADMTGGAVFTSSNPAVATVDAKGLVRAVGDGEAVITAELNASGAGAGDSGSEGEAAGGGRKSATKVTVSGTGRAFTWSFPLHIQPVLTKAGCNSGACHGAAAGKNGFRLSLRGYDNDWDHAVLTRQAAGRRVSLAEPVESLLLLKATQGVNHGGGVRFEKDSEEYARVLKWIESGAPGQREADAAVDRIEVTPRFVTLGPGAAQQVLVSAVYSDGRREDVTRWAKFGTTDDGVAIVDDLGKVTVKGPGAAAITVWYSSKVSFAQLTIPREKAVPAEVYEQAARGNFIDDLVLKQNQNLNIAPAAICTDAEFIRRVYLDCIGLLPKPEEVARFTVNPLKNKREKLIDALLKRPEFTDYWSYKWSDVFLLSSRKLTRRPELLAFYRFIRESVGKNKPWDQFAREVITARGSSLENGAANYYVMHKDPIDLTETTSQAFLGMSVTCARCHNHPLEKWTQNDYYGMANIFSRVRLKNGPGGRDTIVLAENFGDIPHPRIGRPMPPRPLDGKAMAVDATGDRREGLADWLVSPENPYFTRAVVNRVWRNFMGRGLVEPEDDLRLTNPASNEELLDALAKDLSGNKFDLQHLMRLIMNSAAYQRSSQPSDPDAPDDRYYSQYIIRRLAAEVVLDIYSQVTDVATDFSGYPAGYRALQLPDSQVGSYFLTAFGRPARNQTCSCERTQATSIAQTLHVANGDTLNKKLSDKGSVVSAMIMRDDGEVVDALYLRALARRPTEKEKTESVAMLAAAPREGEGLNQARREAIEDIAWAILGGKEFIFNH